MSDIKLFRIQKDKVEELKGTSVALEKSLQVLIDQNLLTLLGVRFVASEHSTGPKHGGRIDTIGLDENGCPVIIEYKRSTNENVINQGLYYLDWLLDHKAEFTLLAMKELGDAAANSILWNAPRLVCIASDFTKYDQYAVQQMAHNIELIRYRHYGDLLLFELVNRTSKEVGGGKVPGASSGSTGGDKTITEQLEQADQDVRDRFERIKAYLMALGDDVQMNTVKLYVAFKRIKNFACVTVTKKAITLYLKIDPDTVSLEKGFTRDVRDIGHWATGDLEITIQSDDDITKAEPLMDKAYEIG